MRRGAQLQVATLVILVGLLEVLCRTGEIPAFTMIAPSRMATGIWHGLASGKYRPSLLTTLSAAAIAAMAAIVSGCVFGVLLHTNGRARRAVEPLLASYYAVPIWSFYPLFVYLFGLRDTPKIIIAYLYAVVAMIISTLNGLDRVPTVFRKTARVFGMGRWEELFRITIPASLGYMITGVKLSVSYALIGVVGSEFILSTSGIGYDIAWAYTSFDNAALYPLILLIIIISVSINTLLSATERSQMRRRARA